MRKFLIALILMIIAGWLVYRNFWKPAQLSGNPAQPPVVHPGNQPKTSTDGIKLFEEGKYEDAVKQLEREIVKCPVNEKLTLSRYLARAYEQLGEYYLGSNLPEGERLYKARVAFSQALRGNLPDKQKEEIKDKLVSINEKLVFSPMPTPDSEMYLVKAGDTIVSISKKYDVSPGSDSKGLQYLGHIRCINKLKTTLIHPGSKLKIITGKFSIGIDKSDFTLTLYLDGNFVKEYPVAIGDPTKRPTPEGFYHIGTKLVNPVWTRTKPDGTKERIPYGDPRNVLGSRWMTLEGENLGIHGTIEPDTIGKPITGGCIRMYNNDVEEIFDLVPVGAEVIIKE